MCLQTKGGLISEGIFPALSNLFKFSAQGSDLAPFVGNGTKDKIPYEIKPPIKVQKLQQFLNCPL